MVFFFFSSRRRHTRLQGDWSSDVCSSDLVALALAWNQTGGGVRLAGQTGPAGGRAGGETAPDVGRADRFTICEWRFTRVGTTRSHWKPKIADRKFRPHSGWTANAPAADAPALFTDAGRSGTTRL